MLRLDGVSKVYKVGMFGSADLLAVRDVSFEVAVGEIVSLIGESGSGKTTIGRMILRLASITRGTITFEGRDIRHERRKTYYRRVQGIFQDPFSSYNPIFKADHVLAMVRGAYFPDISPSEWSGRVEASLKAVGLAPEQVLHKYPHQLSGGQLQRLLIARALLLDIRMLVADEIISMLDASTRIDVLNLLADLSQRGLGILFITHDLSLGNYVSAKTVILNRGRIVEMGATSKVYGSPLHPYTRALLSAVPQLHRTWREVDGELAGSVAATGGQCLYHMLRGGPGGGSTAERRGWDGIPTDLVEVEPDHLVGCVRPFLEGVC